MTPTGDTDINLHSFYGHEFDGQEIDLGAVDATGYDDAIKLGGGVTRLTVRASFVKGGSEDVADLNDAHDCLIAIDRAEPGGNFAASIKGASTGNTIRMNLTRHAREVDIDLGNYSEQQSGRTRRTTLDVRMEDGSRVRVRVLKSERPVFAPESGPYCYAFPSPNLGPLHRIIVAVVMKFLRKTSR